MQCLICLDNIDKCDLLVIKHNKCRYSIHDKCFYDKCLYCHSYIVQNNKNNYNLLLTIIEKITDNFILIDLNKIIDIHPILFIVHIINIYTVLFIIICPTLIGYIIINHFYHIIYNKDL
jgi:hypothetical protein